jgi:hypothetical protein
MEDLAKLISTNFDASFSEDYISENDLILALADRVAYMMDHEKVLSSDEPNAIGLAKLIMERQKQRIETRKKYSEKS